MPRAPSLLSVLALCLPLALLCVACGGGGGGGGATAVAPSNLTYAVATGLYRVGEAIPANAPTVDGDPVTTWSVAPALPGGLTLDPVSGTINGTPAAEAGTTTHTVTAANAGGSTTADVDIAVGMQLPAAFSSLMDGFQAEAITLTPSVQGVVKLARAADGRIFFIEVNTGDVRVIHPVDGLLATPYLDLSSVLLGAETWSLVTGNHQGLFGLVLHPDFTNNGFVYVMLTLENAGQSAQKSVVLRFTDDSLNNVGTNQATVLDDLPTATINNGGELLFDPDGVNLFVTVGDVTDSSNAQTDVGATPASKAGKILRVSPTIPASVPGGIGGNVSGTFEYVRGVRNCFGLALHPVTGRVFATDNEGSEMATGFSMVDEINLVTEAKNYEWGAADGSIPGADTGFAVWSSPGLTVTPTCLEWHTGAGLSTATTDSLLVGFYNADAQGHTIHRLVMSGPLRADIDAEDTFAKLAIVGNDNQPLDIHVDRPTGDIYLAVRGGIYCISRIQ